jgi:single-stranded-DNA-specific exonuclease
MHRRVWRLAELNHARKQETKQGFEVALRMALVGGGSVCAAGAIHAGVTGIVAQKLVDRLNRVAVVLSQGEEGTLKGSARGLPGLDLVDAIRTIEQSGCLKHPVKYGGHEGAIGLTIHADDYPVFADQFDLYCCYETPHRPPPPPDATIRLSDISDELFDDLEKLGPFGAGNPDPVFGVQDLKVTAVRIMAREHTSVELWDGKDHSLAGVMWNIVEHPSLVMSKKVDATFTLGKNTYQGRTTIQATLRTVIDIGDREWRSRLGYVP